MIWNIGGCHKFSKEESEENDLAQFLLRQDKEFGGGRISIRSRRDKWLSKVFAKTRWRFCGGENPSKDLVIFLPK